MRPEASSNGRDVPCPGCGLSTLLRGDTGMCERCTAKTPGARFDWHLQRQRELAKSKQHWTSKRLPPGHCIVCAEPYGDLTVTQHDRICPARPEVCVCGRRYWTPHNLRAHQYSCKQFRET